MSIRPADISGMIQRTQDVSNIKQNEDNKPIVQQYNIGVQKQKQDERMARQVSSTEKKENEGFRYDAKEKGSNSYEGKREKKGQKKEKKDGKVLPKTTSGGFDIKI